MVRPFFFGRDPGSNGAEGLRSEELRDHIEPLLASRGYSLVEVSVARRHGSPLVSIVVHRDAGVSIADCEQVASLVRHHPSLGTFVMDADLEVCSPGTDRKIRDNREYAIFRGRGIRILRKSGEWIRGRIVDAEDGEVTILGGGNRSIVPMGDIKRAFLDEQQEVQT